MGPLGRASGQDGRPRPNRSGDGPTPRRAGPADSPRFAEDSPPATRQPPGARDLMGSASDAATDVRGALFCCFFFFFC